MFDLWDLLVLVWSTVHNLDDPFVIISAASLGGGTLAAMRRLDGVRDADSWRTASRRVLVGSMITATTSGALAAVGVELFPTYPKLVLGLIVFFSAVVDTTTDEGRSWIVREILGRLLAMFDAARNGGKYSPPTPGSPPTPASKPTSTPEVPGPSTNNSTSTPSAETPKVNQPAPRPKKGPW